jgi:S-adenosylmethionine decarboxylase
MSKKSETGDKLHLQKQHLLADLFGIEDTYLKDPDFFIALLKKLAASAQLTPLIEPQVTRDGRKDYTGFILLKETHISFHAYPDANYLAIDIFTSSDNDLEPLFEIFSTTFNPKMVRKTTIARGPQT